MKLFYGNEAGSSAGQASSTKTLQPPPTVKNGDDKPAFFDLSDFEIKPEKQPEREYHLNIMDDLPDGFGKKLHFNLL